ncbi:MAG: response regulator [Methylococcaceae bacterium]|nr:response regulator [Methylococcaceae bacterium]
MNIDEAIIAVIDDEASVCKGLERLLRSAGRTAKTFLTASDFLKFLKTGRLDCVVLDLNMPFMNGFAVLEQLALEHSKLPVIIITGDGDEEAYENAMNYSIAAYLSKPVDGQVLLDAIASAIVRGTNPE